MLKEFDKINIFAQGGTRIFKTQGTFNVRENSIEINFSERDDAYKYFIEVHLKHHEITSLLISKGEETNLSQNYKTIFIMDADTKVMLIKQQVQ
ncbi:hypothetical protein [Rummeliibacillus sp. BSL5]